MSNKQTLDEVESKIIQLWTYDIQHSWIEYYQSETK